MDKREQTARTEYIKSIVNNLPDAPGCYQYLNDEGVIIYVGKAKNLKRRVSSYFNKEQQTMKTRLLVSKIADIKYIVVNSESDALLLENNLIKKHKPRYNVLLKDDKTYPSICITGEYYPRIFKTRKIVPGIGRYYGPYSNAGALSALLQLIKEMYPLRTCRLNLTPEAVRSGKFSPCLEYQIKNCCAPCISATTHEEYQRYIEEVRDILKGDIKKLTSTIIAEMQREAENLNFEKAQILKERYQLIENFRTRSEVVSPTISNVDVFSIESDEKSAFINFLHITNGCINQAFTLEYKKRLDESDEELLSLAIVEMRERFGSNAPEIIIPFEMEIPLQGVTLTLPQRGEKAHLLSLSKLNVKQYRADRLKQEEKLNPEQKSVRLMKEIQEALHLEKLPIVIESFDTSNLQGDDAVAACVVFVKLKPSKKDYRKYTIKTVTGADDYASMREVVRRRYTRSIAEGTTLPNLIIADGGVGHIETIRKVVEEELNLNIPIAGLAKNDKHRTRDLIFNSQVISMKTNDVCFNFLTQIQNEVHRFAIEFHRDKRSKSQLKSELDEIPGIGPNTKEKLLKELKSVKRIQNAEISELEKIIGTHRASIVYEYFHTN